MRLRTLTTTLTTASGLLAATLVLAGCTQPSGPTGTSPSPAASATQPGAAEVNAADEMFVTMMIPHHEQAVEMSDVLLAKPDADPDVRDLAQRIKDAQGPEIELMEGWLDAWGVDDDGSMPVSEHDMGHDDGMMSADDLTALEAADGPEASRLFLEQMIVHHQGAIDMAETAVASGRNPDVVALAQRVIVDQTAEIATMRGLLEAR